MNPNTPAVYEQTAVAVPVEQRSGSLFNSLSAFSDAQRVAKALASSSLVPQNYQNNIANTLVALEMAQRTNSSPMAVMQNMHVIHGRPSWSSQFVIAALNSCGRFTPIRFEMSGDGDNRGCVAWAVDREIGERIDGPMVTIKMAKEEGWFGKSGSKWKTMPELMLRYRAAKFFGNLYAPDILMGMSTSEESDDIWQNQPQPKKKQDVIENTFDHYDEPSPLVEVVQQAVQKPVQQAVQQPAKQPEPEPQNTMPEYPPIDGSDWDDM